MTLSTKQLSTATETDPAEVLLALTAAANAHDVGAMRSYLAPDMSFENPVTPASNRDGMAAFHGGLFAAFPDIAYRVDRVTASGGHVVLEITVTGTHEAEFAGVPASNHRIELLLVVMADVVDGKVARFRSLFDTGLMLRQIGAG